MDRDILFPSNQVYANLGEYLPAVEGYSQIVESNRFAYMGTYFKNLVRCLENNRELDLMIIYLDVPTGEAVSGFRVRCSSAAVGLAKYPDLGSRKQSYLFEIDSNPTFYVKWSLIRSNASLMQRGFYSFIQFGEKGTDKNYRLQVFNIVSFGVSPSENYSARIEMHGSKEAWKRVLYFIPYSGKWFAQLQEERRKIIKSEKLADS